MTRSTRHVRLEALARSIARAAGANQVKTSEHRYKTANQRLARMLRTIPLGSQTFSKSKTQYPHGVSPYLIERGKGAHVRDA